MSLVNARCLDLNLHNGILLNLSQRTSPCACCFAISLLEELYNFPATILSHSFTPYILSTPVFSKFVCNVFFCRRLPFTNCVVGAKILQVLLGILQQNVLVCNGIAASCLKILSQLIKLLITVCCYTAINLASNSSQPRLCIFQTTFFVAQNLLYKR